MQRSGRRQENYLCVAQPIIYAPTSFNLLACFCADGPFSGRHTKGTVNLSFLVKRAICFVRGALRGTCRASKAPKLFQKRVASSTTQGLPSVHQQRTDTPNIVPVALRRLGSKATTMGPGGRRIMEGNMLSYQTKSALCPCLLQRCCRVSSDTLPRAL